MISCFLVILSPPLPVNASLGSNAEFNCMCHYCIGQYWLVNDISANYQENYDKGVRRFGPIVQTNGSKLYTVKMPASIQLNESTIECVAYNATETTASVKLLVQGMAETFMLLFPTQPSSIRFKNNLQFINRVVVKSCCCHSNTDKQYNIIITIHSTIYTNRSTYTIL